MRKDDTPVTPPLHPVEALADELCELEMTAAGLARELHAPSNRLYQITAGKRALMADTALQREQWLGGSSRFWPNPRQRRDLEPARAEVCAEITRPIRRGRRTESRGDRWATSASRGGPHEVAGWRRRFGAAPDR